MISASDYFSSERVENIKSLVSFSIAYTEEFYKIMEEISNAHLRWDIPYYKPSPEHPLENIAYYLCQKWGIPNNNAEILKIAGIEAPNTFLVYMVEAALLMSMKCWKFINERYDIIFD
jgi:hypothetical protein